MSLREKLIREKSSVETAAVDRQELERVAKEKAEAEAEQAKKLEVLREQIALREKQQTTLDNAIKALGGGYAEGSEKLETLKSKKGDVAKSRVALEKADGVIEALLQNFPEILSAQGITTKAELLSADGTKGEDEIVGYKRSKAEVDNSQEQATVAWDDLRTSVGSIRKAKKAAREIVPDVGSFRKEEREASLERLVQYKEALVAEIEKLKNQTPEVQEVARERLEKEFKKRFEKDQFFANKCRDIGVVEAQDIQEARKYGSDLVRGTLSNQVEEKLNHDVEQAKEVAGITGAKKELIYLEQLQNNFDALEQRVESLRKRREALIQSFGSGESNMGKRISGFLHESKDYARLAKDDPGRAWVLYMERGSFCQSLFHQYANVEGGVPGILSNFLAGKKEGVKAVNGRRYASGDTPVKAGDLPDVDALGKYLEAYERFLENFEKIIEDKPEAIAHYSRDSKEGEESDSDILRKVFGYSGPLADTPLKGADIKSQIITSGLISGKSFAEMRDDITKGEEPFDKAHKERGDFLKSLLDKEWSEKELSAFEREHPEVRALQNRAEVNDNRNTAKAELTPRLMLVEESMTATGDSFAVLKIQLRTDSLTLLHCEHPEHSSAADEDKNARQKLQRIRNDIQVNKQTKRPLIHFGKTNLDKELDDLKIDEGKAQSELEKAEAALKAINDLRTKADEMLRPVVSVLDKGHLNVGRGVVSVAEFLNRAKNVVESPVDPLSPAEEDVLKENSRLKQNSARSSDSRQKVKSTFNYESARQLRTVGWRG